MQKIIGKRFKYMISTVTSIGTFALVVGLLSQTACAASPSTPESIVVVSDDNYPPYIFWHWRYGFLVLVVAVSLLLLANLILSHRFRKKSTDLIKSKQLLAENHELMKLFLFHSPIYTFVREVTESENRFVMASENFKDLTQFSDTEIVGKTVQEAFPEAVAAVMTKNDKTLLQEGGIVKTETSLNGLHFSVAQYPIRLGDRILLAGYATDITERINAEKSRQETELRYRVLTENMKDVVWILDTETLKLLYVSPSVFKLRGYTAEEIIGNKFTESLFPGQMDAVENIVRVRTQEFKEGKITSETFFVVELRQPRRDGTSVTTEMIAHFWMNFSTGKLELHGSVRNVEERKRVENELRESRRRYAALLDRLPGMAYRRGVDTRWTFEFVSSGCKQVTGYTADELTHDRKVSYLDLLKPEDADKVKTKWAQALKTRASFDDEYQIIGKHGDVRWVWEKAEGLYDKDGTVIAVEGFISDITQQIVFEGERSALQAQVLQAQKLESVGCLAGGIAHDFNNMLQAIMGYAELALDQISPDVPLHNDIQEIKAIALRSTNLTRQLLTFARKQPIEPKESNVNDMIDGMKNMLHRLVGENIEIVWNPSPEIPTVMIDKGQFEQIIFNLCINARDAMNKTGQIKILTTLHEIAENYPSNLNRLKSGNYVEISVRDNGGGISSEIKERIFEPFFTTKPLGRGTGLGLSVVYGIVAQCGGTITVETELGQGTEFRIFLPVFSRSQTSQIVPEAIEVLDKPIHATILIVDDEILILQPTRQLLESLGHHVIATNSPHEAIQIMREGTVPINLLISDVMMPEMSGPKMVIELLKTSPQLKYIFMSGHTANLLEEQGLDRNDTNFIEKPFSRKELKDKVQEVLKAYESIPVEK